MIKAVFFDADDTLLDHYACERLALMHMFSNLGIAYQDSYQDVFRPLDNSLWNNTYVSADPSPPIPKEEIPVFRFAKLFELINIKYDDPARANVLFQEGFRQHSVLVDHAVEAVEYVHSKELPIYIVTNGIISLQNPRVMNSAVGKYISYVMVSEEAGVGKPNPKIFELLLKKIGLAPEDVIMIGDKLGLDVLGAKNAGIRSIWFNFSRKDNDTDILPDYEIHDLLDLKGIL